MENLMDSIFVLEKRTLTQDYHNNGMENFLIVTAETASYANKFTVR